MGGRNAKQQSQTGSYGYWPYAGLFGGLYGFDQFCGGLSPFFGFNGYNVFNGISPLALPYSPYAPQSLTTGTLKMKNTLTKATFNYKW